MLWTIPTYEVIVYPDSTPARRSYRVPQTDLDAFLRVLTFNRIQDFRVMLEEGPLGNQEMNAS